MPTRVKICTNLFNFSKHVFTTCSTFSFGASLFHYPTIVARICCLLPNTISVKLRVTHRPKLCWLWETYKLSFWSVLGCVCVVVFRAKFIYLRSTPRVSPSKDSYLALAPHTSSAHAWGSKFLHKLKKMCVSKPMRGRRHAVQQGNDELCHVALKDKDQE